MQGKNNLLYEGREIIMTMLAVFRSRAHTLDFVARLKAAGVPVQTVATPPEAGVGCGISAKFEENFFPRVSFLIAKRPYASFSGFMKSMGGSGYVYIRG